MKKSMVSISGALGIVLALVLTASGCASFGIIKYLGALTITGIPEAYEGWTVDIPFAAGIGTISNGAVNMTIQGKVNDAGTTTLAFNITNAGSTSAGLFFESVRFENQAATVQWDAGVKTGLLTVTGIPDRYNRDTETHTGSVVVLSGHNLRRGGALALLGGWTGSEASNQGWVLDGAVSLPLWAMVDGLPTPYTETTTTKVLLDIAVGSVSSAGGAVTTASTENIFFESVQLTDGNATVNFSQGVKQ